MTSGVKESKPTIHKRTSSKSSKSVRPKNARTIFNSSAISEKAFLPIQNFEGGTFFENDDAMKKAHLDEVNLNC